MRLPLDSITNARELWNFRSSTLDFHRQDNTFTVNLEGIVYRCSFSEEGPVMLRKDTVCNTTDAPRTLSVCDAVFRFLGSDYQVYTQSSIQLSESVAQWQPLHTQVGASGESIRSTRTAAPMLALWNNLTGRGTVFHLLTDSSWQISANCSWDTYGYAIKVTAGFYNSPCITLAPGETISLPTILFYDFRNQLDLDAWKLHRWFQLYHPRKEMPVVYNTWLYRFDHFSPADIEKQIPVAAELGMEYFVVDAGWFGVKGQWTQTLGDWEETKESAMQGQLLRISQAVQAQGMLFGLWFELERASKESTIYKTHPEYFVEGYNFPMLNFGLEAVQNYTLDLMDRMIAAYNIRYIKFDHNRDLLTIEGDETLSKYFAGYRQFLRTLQAKHPNVYLECCGSGGMRMDINNALYFNSFWLSDNQSPYHTMRIYKDTLRRLPPQAIERWLSFVSLPGFRPAEKAPYCDDKMLAPDDGSWSSLVSLRHSWVEGMMLGSPAGLSCDLTSFTPAVKTQIKNLVAQIKAERNYWLNAQCRILCDTENFLVLEYADADFDQIDLFAYTNHCVQMQAPVYPVVDTGASYQLDEKVYTGEALDAAGISLRILNSRTVVHKRLNKIQ